jgi:universal stress protein E
MSEGRWKSILAVVTDPFAREQLAASKAARVAARTGAQLTLFNAFMVPQPTSGALMDSSEQVLAGAIRQRRERLQALAARLRSAGSRPIRVAVEWDFPAHEAIVRQALAMKPDLVIAESHRHGRLARWVLANTDWELIRTCPTPLWFVRSDALPRAPRVMVAVDPRHTHAKPARLDDRLLAAARAIVQHVGGAIEIVHAYEPPLTASSGALMEPVRWPVAPQRGRDFVEAVHGAVNRLADRHEIPERHRLIEEGPTSEVLARLARTRKVDVLVMGAVSRSLLERPVIGSTAERVIDRVGCDLFIAKPAGFKTTVPRRERRMSSPRRLSRAGARSERQPAAMSL